MRPWCPSSFAKSNRRRKTAPTAHTVGHLFARFCFILMVALFESEATQWRRSVLGNSMRSPTRLANHGLGHCATGRGACTRDVNSFATNAAFQYNLYRNEFLRTWSGRSEKYQRRCAKARIRLRALKAKARWQKKKKKRTRCPPAAGVQLKRMT